MKKKLIGLNKEISLSKFNTLIKCKVLKTLDIK